MEMSAAIVTIDGYPLHPTDTDFASQELLTRTLENCRAVAPLFPTIGQLFPEICKMPDPSPLRVGTLLGMRFLVST